MEDVSSMAAPSRLVGQAYPGLDNSCHGSPTHDVLDEPKGLRSLTSTMGRKLGHLPNEDHLPTWLSSRNARCLVETKRLSYQERHHLEHLPKRC